MNLHSKKDFQDCMLSILEPLKPYYSEEKARLTLGVTMAHYDIGATWMEAFSRPLWGLVPFWAGGGKEPEFEEIYRKGLTAGTDEKNPEYWGECTSFDQRFVEMAAISYGIMFAPEVVWDPLTEAQKENLCNYLNKINEHPLPVCNWILFAVLVNIAMKKVGRRYSHEMLEEYLESEIIQIAPLAYMRGRTLNDSFVILDEAQNTTRNQLKMFLTRMGISAKFVITGDMSQLD